jgi:hypothetical protein
MMRPSLAGRPLLRAALGAVKAFNAKEQRLQADVGNKYASFLAIGIEGVEQK